MIKSKKIFFYHAFKHVKVSDSQIMLQRHRMVHLGGGVLPLRLYSGGGRGGVGYFRSGNSLEVEYFNSGCILRI